MVKITEWQKHSIALIGGVVYIVIMLLLYISNVLQNDLPIYFFSIYMAVVTVLLGKKFWHGAVYIYIFCLIGAVVKLALSGSFRTGPEGNFAMINWLMMQLLFIFTPSYLIFNFAIAIWKNNS